MEYTALQVKSSYSLLKSLNNIKKLISHAKLLGYTSLAITDENNLFGIPEFYQECKKNNIKPILGIEITIEDTKILLYATNNNGYHNLIKLSTIISEKTITKEDLVNHKDDLIMIMPLKYYDEEIYNIYSKKYIGYSNFKEKKSINFQNKVFINNVSYLNPDDHQYLDYLYMIKNGKTLGEYELNTHQNQFLLPIDKLNQICDKEDIENSNIIATSCNVTIEYTKNLLPIYDATKDAYQYLSYLCQKGLNRRLNNSVPEVYTKRLEYELNIINKMNFCNYFLIVWDYVKYAKKENILVGPGRGSAAGSLVSYTLGITDIDPIKYNLLFERFLNPERVTMPDIDVDFDSQKRQEVINYVTNKYGTKKVAGIITFDTLASKQVIRDVGRVMKISLSDIDAICNELSKSGLIESYKQNIKLRRIIDNSTILKKLYKIAVHLEGLPRNIGIHASGIVMSNVNLDEVIPLYKNSRGIYTTAYSMNYLEPLGLLKMDFLGISNLTLIDEVLTNIRNQEHLNITLSNIPLDDKKTLQIFNDAQTDGIFQFESSGMKRFLQKLKVSSFDDLIAALALYRPGSMDYIDNYIRRKEGKEKIEYYDDSLEKILKPTYGIIIYQEQILEIARTLAGYTLGEADILRRAISKKKESILLAEKPKFINKSIEKGYSKELAEKIYNLILKFANYGFNKSHSVGYATVAYKMAFLKTYFFKYFEIATLNNVIGNELKTNIYISEIKQHNIKLLPPDINKSDDKYKIEGDCIRCPLSIIKNVASSISKEIISSRKLSPYKSFVDFVKINYSTSINKKVLISLIKAGCFSNLGYNEPTLINNIDNVINYAELSKDAGMLELSPPKLIIYDDYSKEELLTNQVSIFGFYLSEHPTNIYRNLNDIETRKIPHYYDKNISLILLVERIKEITTKKNDTMAFVTASDEFGQISLTLFPKIYKQYSDISKGDIIRIRGLVEKRFDKYQVIVNNLKILKKQ